MPNSEFLACNPTQNPVVAGDEAGPDPVDLRRRSNESGAYSAMLIGDDIGLPIRERRAPKVVTLRFNYPKGTIEHYRNGIYGDSDGAAKVTILKDPYETSVLPGYAQPAPEPEVTPTYRRNLSRPDLIISYDRGSGKDRSVTFDPNVDKPGKLG